MSARRFLDVSSGHLQPETWAWLDEQTTDEQVCDPAHRHAAILGGRTRHGWFIYASEAPYAPVPADLLVVMRYVRKRGCEYVLLDTDALPIADLPVLHPDFPDHPVPPATP